MLIGVIRNIGTVCIAMHAGEGNFNDIIVQALYDIGIALAAEANCKFRFVPDEYFSCAA